MMNYIITGIILVAGYFGINRAIVSGIRRRSTAVKVSVVVLFLYACLMGMVGLIYVSSGYDWFVIYSALLVLSAGIFGILAYRAYQVWRYINKICFVLFLFYVAVVLWVTLFMRVGTISYASVLTDPFARITAALETGDMELLTHFLLNIAMFVPMGFLLKMCDPDRSNSWGNSLLLGVLTSTIIETCQMILFLGECDIDDIIANTIGCVAGFLLAQLWLLITRNWSV